MREALGDGFNYIHSVETDLNTDPLMVKKISELNKFTIISNSNSHTTNFHILRERSLFLV